ncbi:MAG: hypothetical protein ACYC1I_02190 [Acidimicrobiales bacterium]
MSTLAHRRNTPAALNALIATAPRTPVQLTDDHRRSLSARFRAVASDTHRRLDAWTVERAGQTSPGFRWSPATARRVLATGALRRSARHPERSLIDAITDEIADQLARTTSGFARRGSLGDWLAGLSATGIALVTAEAVNWAAQGAEIGTWITFPWRVAPSDAYYDVARARTTLRGRRDLEVTLDESRVVLRLRAGSPGKSAGPGLRSDLTIEALTHPDGLAPARIIGVWPEAGVCLSVDGTMDDLRSGARDLVRTAVVQRRIEGARAA